VDDLVGRIRCPSAVKRADQFDRSSAWAIARVLRSVSASVEDINPVTRAWYRFRHRGLIARLEQGPVHVPSGQISIPTMAQVTAGTGREVALSSA
jgi:hypothetical protein